MAIYGIHDPVVMAWLLIEFDAQVQKNKLKDILFILGKQMFEPFVKFLSFLYLL